MKLGIRLPALETKPEDQARGIHSWLTRVQGILATALDGAGLGFGDGVDVDNIKGKWVSYTTNAVANTEDTITHNLGVIPIGFLIFSIDKGGVVYKGTTAWTATQMFLKCSVASVAVLLFVITPSNK